MTDDLTTRMNDELEAEYGHEQTEAWRIEDMDQAAWASRKAATCATGLDTIDAWEKREINRIKMVAQKNRNLYEKDQGFFLAHLRNYLERLVQEGRPTKSLDLPGGKVSLRTRQPLVDVGDEGKALEYAKNEGKDWIRIKEALDKTAFKKGVTLAEGGVVVDSETGEVLPFARWEAQDESLSFSPVVEGGE